MTLPDILYKCGDCGRTFQVDAVEAMRSAVTLQCHDCHTRKTNSLIQWFRHMTNWFQDALDTLRKLADLKENWGGEGELPIASEAISNAMRLAYQLDKQQMPQPTIVPGRDGEVQLEWHIGDNYLEIVCFTEYTYFCQIGEVETHGITLEPLALVANCIGRMQ